jgi:hypothetical protein
MLCSYGKDRTVREQDQKMEEHLRGLGFNVTTKNVWELRPEDAQGKGLIVLTASAGGGDQLADKIRFMRDLQIPILASSPGCYSALSMADDIGHSDGKVDFNVPLKDHVLTQKQKDPFTPLKEGEVLFAHPTGEALAVVTNKDNQDQVAVFAYEPGTQMKDDLRAPARGLLSVPRHGPQMEPGPHGQDLGALRPDRKMDRQQTASARAREKDRSEQAFHRGL